MAGTFVRKNTASSSTALSNPTPNALYQRAQSNVNENVTREGIQLQLDEIKAEVKRVVPPLSGELQQKYLFVG